MGGILIEGPHPRPLSRNADFTQPYRDDFLAVWGREALQRFLEPGQAGVLIR